MLFFQAGLLLGYTYAHLAIRPFPPKAQVAIHLILISAAIATLPITPSDTWKPNAIENPTGYIFLLYQAARLPYAMLSATSPLLQSCADHPWCQNAFADFLRCPISVRYWGS